MREPVDPATTDQPHGKQRSAGLPIVITPPARPSSERARTRLPLDHRRCCALLEWRVGPHTCMLVPRRTTAPLGME
jgi:hypothetical protein